MMNKKRQASIYAKRKSDGVCPCCGGNIDRSGSLCSKCLKKVTNRNKRRKQNNPVEVRTWFREYARDKTASDPIYKIKKNLRRAVWGYLRNGEKASVTGLLGCTSEQLAWHLEEQMLAGMNWENFGRGADRWQVDHIRPLASFDLSDPDQLASACHYTNLQPLWAVDNIRKGARYVAA